MYQKLMDPARNYIKKNNVELLNAMNSRLEQNLWDKYCEGTISKWEMDSVSYYSHEHELYGADMSIYGCADYADLPEEPIIDKKFWKDGKEITMYKIHRIAGTVLDKKKSKGSLSLLTTSGVVTVKIFGPVFTQYDKQISERGADGKKHVIEKSTFSRGNKIIVTGIRQGDSFLAKTYAKTPWHKVEQIVDINGGDITIKSERASA